MGKHTACHKRIRGSTVSHEAFLSHFRMKSDEYLPYKKQFVRSKLVAGNWLRLCLHCWRWVYTHEATLSQRYWRPVALYRQGNRGRVSRCRYSVARRSHSVSAAADCDRFGFCKLRRSNVGRRCLDGSAEYQDLARLRNTIAGSDSCFAGCG